MATESALTTPGVYVREIALFPPSIAQVETAIPAFIGNTEKDDTGGIPTRITSLSEYEALFGTAGPQTVSLNIIDKNASPIQLKYTKEPELKSILYYSIQMFYQNGGGPCYVVSAGKDINDVKRDDLKAALDKLESYDEPTLIVIPDTFKLSNAEAYGLMNDALALCAKMQDRFAIIDVQTKSDIQKKDNNGNPMVDANNQPVMLTAPEAFREVINGDIEKAKYGAAYYPNLKTLMSFNFSDDTKITDTTSNTTLDKLKTTDNDSYNKIRSALNNKTVEVPPSGAVAGLYAATDNERGVWKAPANVTVTGVTGPSLTITDEAQGDLNVDTQAGKSINAIRSFTGKGTLVWGARTLAGNDNEWRYVPVRRLFIMVEESVKKATARFVFEPNDANTWIKVRGMIENYLTVLWRQGALAGAKPEQAFFVRCGLNTTMTAQDILDGKLIIEIGMAAVRPAEFIILRFMHKMQES